MFAAPKTYQRQITAKQKKQRIRQNKSAFMEQGLVDWHLSFCEKTIKNNELILVAGPDGNDDDTHHDDDTVVLTAPPQLKRPVFYAVVLFNDDYTPMEFVIEVLQNYFALDLDRATEVMLTVHYRGKGVAGIYPRDIAETKAQQVNNYARSQGHPLLCQIEPQPE